MQARDATGRQVSLLNDDAAPTTFTYPIASQRQSVGDASPLSCTPELLRSDSYDSNASCDPASPLTPALYEYTLPHGAFDDYLADKHASTKRPAYVASSRSNSFEDDSTSGSAAPERPGKRYPCRYRDSHGCEKTFTTSGHASRHSKIHTAEKAVQCTYPSCNKKFTRADNMKQHLETHFKDKSRSSASSKPSSRSPRLSSRSPRPSVKRASMSSRHSSKPSQSASVWDADVYGTASDRLPSPTGAWDMRGLNHQVPLPSRPVAERTSSGLDALAAIACQAGGGSV